MRVPPSGEGLNAPGGLEVQPLSMVFESLVTLDACQSLGEIGENTDVVGSSGQKETPRFTGVLEADEGLDPSTFCMATRPGLTRVPSRAAQNTYPCGIRPLAGAVARRREAQDGSRLLAEVLAEPGGLVAT
jgi:hypothetical protein